jgi:hypothetical protein
MRHLWGDFGVQLRLSVAAISAYNCAWFDGGRVEGYKERIMMRARALAVLGLVLAGVMGPDMGMAQEPAIFKGHTKAVLSVAYSPDSKTLASGSEDKSVKLWDVATGR